MSDHRLCARGVVAGYDRGDPILHGVDLAVADGRVTTIVGPNGCGKSTLLRVLAHLLPTRSGEVTLDGRPLDRWSPRERARRIAMLPQNPVAPEGMTVADLVARGRQPHQPWYRQWSPDDEVVVDEALEATGTTGLADRPLEELSGGQRQRAWIAMVLAQQADVVLLDEPTTHLDLAHAVEVLDLVTALCRDTGRTIVTVLHDLTLAARHSDHLVVMRDGQVQTEGPPAEVVTPDVLRRSFDLEARVFPDPVDGAPTVVPLVSQPVTLRRQ